DSEDRDTLLRTVERLRMLQLAEHGLAVGDLLPEFTLPDTDGALVSSDALLARGPLVTAFIRGPWCPYCSLALDALDRARPEIEQRGASLVVISPVHSDELLRAANQRGLGLRLLTDPGGAYARVCGVQYEMTPEHAELYRRLGWDVGRINAGSGYELPVPATYVTARDGVIGYAFADVDWTRRAEPADIIQAVAHLAPE
ncbi:MAG: peroxiredoxin-like family protein, partial [Geminicoccaceae bacterium]